MSLLFDFLQNLLEPEKSNLQKLKLTGLLMICALGISSCASVGVAVPPPKQQTVPAELMQKPEFEKRAREELLETPPKPIAG